MNRQPDGIPVGGGPFHPVAAPGGDGQAIPGLQPEGPVLSLEEESGFSAQKEDELALLRVIPETGGRAVAPGDDSLDLQPPALGEDFNQFFREAGRDILQEISFQ